MQVADLTDASALAPTNLDASGNRITNPQTCDRSYTYTYKNGFGQTYVTTLNYSQFCNFYMVK